MQAAHPRQQRLLCFPVLDSGDWGDKRLSLPLRSNRVMHGQLPWGPCWARAAVKTLAIILQNHLSPQQWFVTSTCYLPSALSSIVCSSKCSSNEVDLGLPWTKVPLYPRFDKWILTSSSHPLFSNWQLHLFSFPVCVTIRNYLVRIFW